MLTQISKWQSATIHEDYDIDDNVKQSDLGRLLSTKYQRVHMIQLI